VKKILFFVFTSLFFVIAISGCAKTVPTAGDSTPTATPIVYVNGFLMQANGNALIKVSLKANSSSGSIISGATISLNGASVPESATPGIYSQSVTGGFTAGSTITFSVTTSLGNVSGATTMPLGASITAPTTGATISHSSMFQINYTNPGPDGSNVFFYLSSPLEYSYEYFISSPGASYSVSSNTIATNSYYISATGDKVMSLTNAVSTSQFAIYNSSNTILVTIN